MQKAKWCRSFFLVLEVSCELSINLYGMDHKASLAFQGLV